ncbi:hypothetical protein JCM14469_23860 [Desulfatiferula olefinivorans]
MVFDKRTNQYTQFARKYNVNLDPRMVGNSPKGAENKRLRRKRAGYWNKGNRMSHSFTRKSTGDRHLIESLVPRRLHRRPPS